MPRRASACGSTSSRRWRTSRRASSCSDEGARMNAAEPLTLELLGVPVCLETNDDAVRKALAICYGLSPAPPGRSALLGRAERGPHGFRVAVEARAPLYEEHTSELQSQSNLVC